MDRMRPVRSGDEPLHARSALRLRLWLAGFGLACAIAGVVGFALVSAPAVIGLFAALAVFAIVDMTVITRHIRAGALFQPGRETPPYRPSLPDRPPRRISPEPDPRRRHARYLWAAGVALVLVVNAWAWVWELSIGWAVGLSIAAGVLLMIGVIASNAGSAILRGNAVPDLPPDLPPDPDAEDERSEQEPVGGARR